MDIQGDNLALEILKWVGIVFAAGFIGYFGRYLAMLIIERIHKRQTPETHAREASKKILTRLNKTVKESQLQFEKKKAKIEAKRARKAQRK